MKIYVASSWKNTLYKTTTTLLTMSGYSIMDWQDSEKGGFTWTQCTDIPVDQWKPEFYRDTILQSERAIRGFSYDSSLMKEADIGVLLLPCGRSAHLEAGWFVGSGKPLFIYMPVWEGPDLMYKFAEKICFTIEELIEAIDQWSRRDATIKENSSD